MTLEQVVVVTDCEDLEQVDTVVEAQLELLRAGVHFVLAELGVVAVVVVKLLVCSDKLWIVHVLWVGFHEWERIVFVCLNVIEDFRGDGDEILRSDERFRDDVRSVRGSESDDRFSHNGDENEENDEEGNDMAESDGDDDDGIHSVRTCEDSRDNGDLKVSDDDESGGRIGDDNN